MEAYILNTRAAPLPPLLRVFQQQRAFENILRHLDFRSVNRLRQTSRFLRNNIDRNPPDIRLNTVLLELGHKEVSLLLQRNPDFNSEGDPFDADIKYIQEDKNCLVKRNGVLKRVLENSEIYKVVLRDLIMALNAQHSVLYRFVITCENSQAPEYVENLRYFHRFLRNSLERRRRPLKLFMLHLSIPPDEAFITPVFCHVDERFITTLQIDNCDATREDTTLELVHTPNARQWANIDFLCVNQGFKLIVPIDRLAQIPKRRVQLHERTLEDIEEHLMWHFENGRLRPEAVL